MIAIFAIGMHNSLTLIFKVKLKAEGKQKPLCDKTWCLFAGLVYHLLKLCLNCRIMES